MARKNLLDLLDQLAPSVRDAFIQAIANIRSDAQEAAFIAAYERGDIEAAVRAIGLGAEYYAPLDQALTQASIAGGDWFFDEVKAMAAAQGAVVVGRFDARNPRAETWLRRQSSRLIVEIVEDQREAVRQVVTKNMKDGVNAQRAAVDIVGRAPAKGQPRKGGIVGLTSQQAGYVSNARAELSDPEIMGRYFERTRRDKRFDSIVRKAMKAGKPVSLADIERITQRYSDRLLKLRGETIARTELLNGMHSAQHEGVEQLIEKGQIRADQVTRIWDAAEDGDTRESHRAANNTKAGPDGTWLIGGHRMKHPGDRSFGAPAGEIINCRCRVDVDIDFIAGLGPGD